MDCEGYRKLLADVEKDEQQSSTHDYRGKLAWVVDRAKHYAEVTGLRPEEILDGWERRRKYWYMNFYQECNQPLLTVSKCRVFGTHEDLISSIGDGFRCPYCNGKSKSPYKCDSGVFVERLNDSGQKPCNWGVGGLFGDLGKGVFVYVKSVAVGERMFMPIAWES